MTRAGRSPLLVLPAVVVDSLLSPVKQGGCAEWGDGGPHCSKGDLGTGEPTPWQEVTSTHVVLLFSPKRW